MNHEHWYTLVWASIRFLSIEFDRNFIDELFKLPKPSADAPVYHAATLTNGDRVLLALKEIGVADEPAAEGETETPEPAADQLSANPRLGNSEFSILLQMLQGKSDIETNEAALSGETGYGGYGYGG